MASTKFFLDCRRTKPGMPSILKLAIGQGDKTAYISLNVKLLPSQWDGSRVVNCKDRNLLNAYLGNIRQVVDTAVYELTHQQLIHKMSAKEIRDYADRKLNPDKYEKEVDQKLFLVRFKHCADSKKDSTKRTYYHTLNRIQAYIGDAALEKLRFEDINKDWLVSFNKFMAQTAPSQNSRNIHFRNMRAVFNDAIDNDITTNYPFRNFKLKNIETEKRSLTVEQLRVLFFFKGEPHAEKYVDMFKLSFYLRGVNIKDVANLKTMTNGRLNFNRSKTGHLYSMFVEPEA